MEEEGMTGGVAGGGAGTFVQGERGQCQEALGV